MDDMITISSDHFETLSHCGGYYECPKDNQGHRLGPLVGYAGTYPFLDGEKAWVGDVHINFAMVEEHPNVLRYFTSMMREKMEPLINGIDVFCGVPIGGYSFSQTLALIFRRQVIKAEKKTIVTTADMLDVREQYKLVFQRHTIRKGARYAIVIDICNNFSRTEELISLIMLFGGTVTAIVCFLNRSMYFDDCYPSMSAGEDPIPIVGLLRRPIMEYRQDDFSVLGDIQCGNVVWDPEVQWPRLLQIMQDNSR